MPESTQHEAEHGFAVGPRGSHLPSRRRDGAPAADLLREGGAGVQAIATGTSPAIQHISLDSGEIRLSALMSRPRGRPRATIVALHGAGMTSRYFHGQALPGLSLLALGARLGFTVLALDRPGYGRSASQCAEGQSLPEQAATVAEALRVFGRRFPTGAGHVLLAHSFGGKLALLLGADHADPGLLGIAVSGCGSRYAKGALDSAGNARQAGRRSWGPLRLYPPNTFRTCHDTVAPTPQRELAGMPGWPGMFHDIAPRVRVPVRFTFAEYEPWWRHDHEAIADLRSRLSAAPDVRFERQWGAGHNISLGWAAHSYHSRCLGFAEECLMHRAAAA